MILYNYFIMRSTVLRFLLSLLLVAVLPMQGYAATRMIACGMLAAGLQVAPDEETQWVQPSPVPDQSVSPRHSHHHDGMSGQQVPLGDMAMPADDASPSHAAVVAVHDHDRQARQAHTVSAGDMSHHASAHAKCSGCAPCCMGAVLTTAPLLIQALPAGSDGFSTPAPAHASAYVGLPERPPQSSLV